MRTPECPCDQCEAYSYTQDQETQRDNRMYRPYSPWVHGWQVLFVLGLTSFAFAVAAVIWEVWGS